MKINFTLNGKPVSVDVAPSELVSDLVRERLGLTGTHVGCDTSQCGACVVHIDGISVKSCTALAVTLDGQESDHDRGPRQRAARCIRCSRLSPRTMGCNAASVRRA